MVPIYDIARLLLAETWGRQVGQNIGQPLRIVQSFVQKTNKEENSSNNNYAKVSYLMR